MTEQEELEQDSGALLPTIAALLTAAAAYKAVGGAKEDAATALDVTGKLYAVLGAIALRIIRMLSLKLPKRPRTPGETSDYELMLEVMESAAEKATQDAIKVVSGAVNGVADDPETSAPPSAAAVKQVATHAARTARNGARFHAAEESGLTFKKTWHSINDERTRSSHAFLGSPKYEFHTIPLADDFISITGDRLRFPGDPLAPLSETARCRCWMTIR